MPGTGRPRRRAAIATISTRSSVSKKLQEDVEMADGSKDASVPCESSDAHDELAVVPLEDDHFSTNAVVPDAGCEDGEFDMDVGSEGTPELEEKYSKADPDYDAGCSDEEQSEDYYAEDSGDAGESVVGSVDQDWTDNRRTSHRSRRPSRPAERNSSTNGFNNGVGAELVPWLKRNFRLSRNPSAIMPRSQLYAKYEKFCAQNGMTVVNSACLGKVLRRSFPGVDTRRLGRRGESKYHYIGLEVNPSGEADADGDDDELTLRQPPVTAERNRPKRIAHHYVPTTRDPLLYVLAALEPDDRTMVVLEIVGKTISSLGFRHLSYLPDILRDEELWSQIFVPGTEADEIQSNFGLIKTFLLSFRIHLGMVAHCIICGAFLALPEIFRNFWIGREDSLQVLDAFATSNAADVAALHGWKPIQSFVADSYLFMYNRIIDLFTPSYESVVGAAFFNLIHQFSLKYPAWIWDAVQKLDQNMRGILYTSALAFSVCLRRATALAASFGKIQPLEIDERKSRYVEDVFSQIGAAWNRIVVNGISAEEYQTMQDFVTKTRQILLEPFKLAPWRNWIVREVSAGLEKIDAAATDCKQRQISFLRQNVFLWITVCRKLSVLARTDVKPVGDFRSIEPFYWLLEFFESFVRSVAEAKMLELESESTVTSLYKVYRKDLSNVGREPLKFYQVSLQFFSDFFIDDLQRFGPNNREFFVNSPDLQLYLGNHKVHSVVEDAVHESTTAEQSMLEQLLR